jgi:hypothetical protein
VDASNAARSQAWSIAAQSRRAGRPPRRPWQPLVRPPVWLAAA